MFDISLYPLFFLGKNQNRKVDVARPLCTPLGFLGNIGVGFGVGEHFGSVIWSLGIAWGKSPPKIHLDSGSPSKSPTHSNENLPT